MNKAELTIEQLLKKHNKNATWFALVVASGEFTCDEIRDLGYMEQVIADYSEI
jgi:hypothetical protein